MKLLLIAVAFAGALAAAGLARAAPANIVDDLQRYCADTGADPDQVMAKAQADGWKPLPASSDLKAVIPASLAAHARMHTSDEGVSVVAAGVGKIADHDSTVTINTCLVAARPLTLDSIRGVIGSWVGVPPDPDQSGADHAGFAYADGPDGRQALVNPDDEKARALVKAGRVRFVYVQAKGDLVSITYVAPKL